MINQIEENVNSAADWIAQGRDQISKCINIADKRVWC